MEAEEISQLILNLQILATLKNFMTNVGIVRKKKKKTTNKRDITEGFIHANGLTVDSCRFSFDKKYEPFHSFQRKENVSRFF